MRIKLRRYNTYGRLLMIALDKRVFDCRAKSRCKIADVSERASIARTSTNPLVRRRLFSIYARTNIPAIIASMQNRNAWLATNRPFCRKILAHVLFALFFGGILPSPFPCAMRSNKATRKIRSDKDYYDGEVGKCNMFQDFICHVDRLFHENK